MSAEKKEQTVWHYNESWTDTGAAQFGYIAKGSAILLAVPNETYLPEPERTISRKEKLKFVNKLVDLLNTHMLDYEHPLAL